MSKVGESIRIGQARAAWAEFESGFRRSQRGNLWRSYDGVCVTIFNRRDGSYGWCISAGEGDTRFSSVGYATEQGAIEAVGSELIVC